MSLTFLAKSVAYSWKMSLAGQVLWKRKVVVCAFEIIGAAIAAEPTAPAAACFRKPRRLAAVVLSLMGVCLRKVW